MTSDVSADLSGALHAIFFPSEISSKLLPHY